MSESSKQQEIINEIEIALEKVRTYLISHGGNVELVRYESGKAYFKLQGTCSGCPSGDHTLKMIVEETLKKEVSQVKEVIRV